MRSSRKVRRRGSPSCAHASKTQTLISGDLSSSFRSRFMTVDFPEPHLPEIPIDLPPSSKETSSAIACATLRCGPKLSSVAGVSCTRKVGHESIGEFFEEGRSNSFMAALYPRLSMIFSWVPRRCAMAIPSRSSEDLVLTLAIFRTPPFHLIPRAGLSVPCTVSRSALRTVSGA